MYYNGQYVKKALKLINLYFKLYERSDIVDQDLLDLFKRLTLNLKFFKLGLDRRKLLLYLKRVIYGFLVVLLRRIKGLLRNVELFGSGAKGRVLR